MILPDGKKVMKKNRVRYYESFRDDFEISRNQNFKLSSDYKWIREDKKTSFLSHVIYSAALIFGFFYCTFFLHVKFIGKRKLKKERDGFFVFANHTQPLGDVFIPALASFPKRIYTVVGTANYGIPVIGHILPYLGALPVTSDFRGIRELAKAVDRRICEGHPVVIYPEAHVWEYCTEIRPFPTTSFTYPAKIRKASYALTTTYVKSKFFKKPLAKIYIDGPFYPVGEGLKEKTESLHFQVENAMKERAKTSDFSYIKYEKKRDV